MTIDIKNEVFGFLTVKKFSHTNGKVRYWLCNCICGKEKLVITANLRNGTTKSCGCMKGYLSALKTGIDPADLAYRSIFNDYKSRAKRKNFDFEFSFDQFKVMLGDRCYYCGVDPILSKTISNKLGSATIFYNGVDRKDNSIGYTINNCVTCCKLCNYAKKALNYNEFISWLNKIKNLPLLPYA